MLTDLRFPKGELVREELVLHTSGSLKSFWSAMGEFMGGSVRGRCFSRRPQGWMNFTLSHKEDTRQYGRANANVQRLLSLYLTPMRCWRNLAHECAENDCPMWMEGFDLPMLDDDSGIGLNESRCAMVLKEKISLYQGLLEIMDFVEHTDGLIDEGFFSVREDAPKRPPKKAAHENRDIFQFALNSPHDSLPESAPSNPHQKKKRGKTKQ